MFWGVGKQVAVITRFFRTHNFFVKKIPKKYLRKRHLLKAEIQVWLRFLEPGFRKQVSGKRLGRNDATALTVPAEPRQEIQPVSTLVRCGRKKGCLDPVGTAPNCKMGCLIASQRCLQCLMHSWVLWCQIPDLSQMQQWDVQHVAFYGEERGECVLLTIQFYWWSCYSQPLPFWLRQTLLRPLAIRSWTVCSISKSQRLSSTSLVGLVSAWMVCSRWRSCGLKYPPNCWVSLW